MQRFGHSAATAAALSVALLAGSAAARPLSSGAAPIKKKPPAPPPTANPLAGLRLYVNPNGDSCKQASAWSASDPAGAAVMDKLCAQPGSFWLGGWFTDITKATSDRVSPAESAGAIATLVLYNIYERGWNLSGGAATPSDYERWIDGVAAGLAGRRAIVVLEPDALAFLGRLSAADQQIRLQLLAYAVEQLSDAGGIVYIDAGHSGWNPVTTMVSRLQGAGAARARGFSLDLANHQLTSNELSYGDAIATGLGGAHFLIDTGRNGAGPGSSSCNDPAWALGPTPQIGSDDPLTDAYLWLKEPGISDGTCNGGTAAGSWWADGALLLAHNAGW